jgi:hypothetical protein
MRLALDILEGQNFAWKNHPDPRLDPTRPTATFKA